MKLLARFIVMVAALLIVTYLVPGFKLSGIWTAVVAAVVISLANIFVKPVLQLIALPISILTLGLSAFLINVFLLWGISTFVPGFVIVNFWAAVISSILLSLVTWFLNLLISD